MLYMSNRQIDRSLEDDSVTDIRSKIKLLQGVMEYLARQNDWERVQYEISSLGSDVNLEYAFLLDEHDRVIASLRIGQQGLDYQMTINEEMVREVISRSWLASLRNRLKGEVMIALEKSKIIGAYPIILGASRGVLRPDRVGMMVLVRDISRQKQLIGSNLYSEYLKTGLASMVLLTVLAVALHFIVTRRTHSLALFAEQMAQGEYKVRADIKGRDEIARLSSALNRMAQEIETKQKELAAEHARIELLMNSTAEAIYGIDVEGKCTFVNPACLKLLGYDRESELLGKEMHGLIHHTRLNGEPYPAGECKIYKSYLTGEEIYDATEIFWRKDGSSVSVEYWAHPILEKGNVIGSVITFMDITQRKQAEAELQRYRDHLEELVHERTAQLEESNKELETYSYSIAHDLRTPLRSIISFSQILYNAISKSLPNDQRQDLTRIITAGKSMSEMIDDILELSLLRRKELYRVNFNISDLAGDVFNSQQQIDTSRNVSWHVQSAMQVYADYDLMRLALVNLISNAWKFTLQSDRPYIEFGKTNIDDQEVFYLSDNGIGFDTSYVDKIFEPFQRLHRKGEFPGTGVGLASVQRIIERHGGRIWAEGYDGKGATFYFMVNQ